MDDFRRRYREIIKPQLMFCDEDRERQNDKEIDFLLKEISNLIKEREELEKRTEPLNPEGLKKWYEEFVVDYYDPVNWKKEIPTIDAFPKFCKTCKSPNYFEESYMDDIDIVCGVCNHTAGYMPGHGYDPITGKKLQIIDNILIYI